MFIFRGIVFTHDYSSDQKGIINLFDSTDSLHKREAKLSLRTVRSLKVNESQSQHARGRKKEAQS